MTEELLKAEDLTVHFVTKLGVVRAVDGVSFSIKQGESLGLVGESGCGKSMTALSIMRVLPRGAQIIKGSVIFGGESLLDKSKREMSHIRGKEIGIILQDPSSALNPVLSIGNQVTETLRRHTSLRSRPLKQRIRETFDSLQISYPDLRLRQYPFQLSGGIKQRVVASIALACNPKLIIADEATTSLDVTTQAYFLALLKRMQSHTGVALLLITHDIAIVGYMCHSVAVMYAGRIVEIASTRSLLDEPMHPYTSGLIRLVTQRSQSVHRLPNIPGRPPALDRLPGGCSFAPRCEQSMHRCSVETPPMVDIADGHRVACWRYE